MASRSSARHRRDQPGRALPHAHRHRRTPDRPPSAHDPRVHRGPPHLPLTAMIDLDPGPEVAELRERVAAFIQATVIPAEQRDHSEHDLDESLRAELQDAARVAGLFAPHVSVSLGGLGLDTRGQAVVFEEAGYSLLGPQALNCAAPDEGNMHLLRLVATAAQRERYLAPLVRGETRSCFAMTEPAPGAGSDPAMLRTTARRHGDDWVLDGDKWFITGAVGAAFAIC